MKISSVIATSIIIGTLVISGQWLLNLYEQQNPKVTFDEKVNRGIILNERYIFYWDNLENPWRDPSRDFYVIPREIKDGWVRFEYEDNKRFNAKRTKDFLKSFELVEE